MQAPDQSEFAKGAIGGAVVAHEVMQPLTAMLLHAEAANRCLISQPPDFLGLSRAVQRLQSDGLRAVQIAGAMKQLTRRSQSDHLEIDINDAIRVSLERLEAPLREHRVNVETSLRAEPLTMWGDKVLVDSMLHNLITNAIDALGVTTGRRREIKVTSRMTTNGRVHVSIHDNGIGMDKKTRSQIFDPLFTTKSNGTGLGLMICRAIVQTHSGRLWVSKNLPFGSIFQFSFPSLLGGSALTLTG